MEETVARSDKTDMRYRDLVLLIVFVAVSAWALEAGKLVEEDSGAEQSSYREYTEDDVPSVKFEIARAGLLNERRFEVTLSAPPNEEWEALNFAQLMVGDQAFEVPELTQLDSDTWAFELSDLSEKARAVLDESEGRPVALRITVLDSKMKMSRAMRTYELESAPISWVAE